MRLEAKTLLVLALLAFFAVPSRAADVVLHWNANPEVYESTCDDQNVANDFAGYNVYWGTAPRSYSNSLALGNVTTHTLSGLSDGLYYFAVSAFDACGNESGFSNEASKFITGSPPAILLSQTIFGPGGAIALEVQNAPGFVSDWVGMFDAGAPHGTYFPNWQYLNGTQAEPTVPIFNTVLIFVAPTTTGNYEFRLYQNDSTEAADMRASVAFTVGKRPKKPHPVHSILGGL